MDKGWIKLNRQIIDNWIYKDKPFNKSMAWIDLLLVADHTTHTDLWRGKMTTFKRGDVNLSISELAKRWGWSRDKTRRFIKDLEKDGMLRVNCTTYRTTLTIVKYGIFQDKVTRDKSTDNTRDKARDKSTDNTYLKNNKEDKEYKEAEPPTLDELAPAEEDEEPPVPGAVRMANGGWNYTPGIDWDAEDEEEEET